MKKDLEQLGRLALRAEGDWWVAYYAQVGTMVDAIPLGQIRLRFVQAEDRKMAFIALMREAMSDIIEEVIGGRPVWPSPPQPAPEHERGGNA